MKISKMTNEQLIDEFISYDEIVHPYFSIL
jgi:hypothetical protein